MLIVLIIIIVHRAAICTLWNACRLLEVLGVVAGSYITCVMQHIVAVYLLAISGIDKGALTFYTTCLITLAVFFKSCLLLGSNLTRSLRLFRLLCTTLVFCLGCCTSLGKLTSSLGRIGGIQMLIVGNTIVDVVKGLQILTHLGLWLVTRVVLPLRNIGYLLGSEVLLLITLLQLLRAKGISLLTKTGNHALRHLGRVVHTLDKLTFRRIQDVLNSRLLIHQMVLLHALLVSRYSPLLLACRRVRSRNFLHGLFPLLRHCRGLLCRCLLRRLLCSRCFLHRPLRGCRLFHTKLRSHFLLLLRQNPLTIFRKALSLRNRVLPRC